jgi:hypothetical protein
MAERTNGHADGLDLDGLLEADTNDTNAAASELAVDEESVRDKRLKEILSRKQAATDMREQARLAITQRKASKAEAASAYRATIESYITAVQPLLHQGDGPHYWSEKEYGTFRLSPPGSPPQHTTHSQRWELPDGTTIDYRPDPIKRSVIGIETLFTADDPIQATTEIKHQRGRFGTTSETYTTVGQIPWGILDDMLIDLNNHVANQGIGIGTDDDDRWTV